MAEKARFVGSVQHTEDTIRLLYKTEYYTYDQLRLLVRMLLGAALAAGGFLASGLHQAARILMMMAGCWFLVSKDFPAIMRAERSLEARRGVLPVNTCTFYDSGMDLEGEGRMRLKYDRFHRLVEDDGYLYLFLGRRSVCMIDKETVDRGTVEELKDYVSKRTGLPWTKNRSLLLMNFADLRQALRDWRKSR